MAERYVEISAAERLAPIAHEARFKPARRHWTDGGGYEPVGDGPWLPLAEAGPGPWAVRCDGDLIGLRARSLEGTQAVRSAMWFDAPSEDPGMAGLARGTRAGTSVETDVIYIGAASRAYRMEGTPAEVIGDATQELVALMAAETAAEAERLANNPKRGADYPRTPQDCKDPFVLGETLAAWLWPNNGLRLRRDGNGHPTYEQRVDGKWAALSKSDVEFELNEALANVIDKRDDTRVRLSQSARLGVLVGLNQCATRAAKLDR